MSKSRTVALLGELGHRASKISLGGTGAGLLRLADGLGDLGWRVDLLTADSRRLHGYGEPLHTSARTHDVGRHGRLFQTTALIRYLLRHRPAALIARDSRAIDIALTATALVPNAPALICALHNQSNVRPDPNPSAEARKEKRFKRIARRADRLLAVSPGLLAAARERLGEDFDRGLVIPNPAYRQHAAEAALADPVPRPAADEGHIVFVGRLSPQKDLGTLLRAFAEVDRRADRRMRLTLVGDGPLRTELEIRVRDMGLADRVTFTGFAPNPMRYMVDADVFVLPSVQDAFGYVLVEALSVGLPIVSTDCPYGPDYVLEHGEYGALVPIGEPAAMADAILGTLESPPERKKLFARARVFDSRRVAADYGDLLWTLIEMRDAR